MLGVRGLSPKYFRADGRLARMPGGRIGYDFGLLIPNNFASRASAFNRTVYLISLRLVRLPSISDTTST